jgi:protein O-mannosyl-transferase
VALRLLSAAVGDGTPRVREDSDLAVAAVVAALVFGMHPLRVEVVAWISARADLMCATFTLLAVLAYLRAVEDGGLARSSGILASALAFAAALLSKGVALPLPAALFLLDLYPLWRLSRLGWRPLVREKVPLLLVMIAGALTVVSAVRHGAVLTQMSAYGPIARLTAVIYACVISLIRFVWPASLSPLYEMPAQISLQQSRFGLALAAAVFITVALLVLRRRWPAGLAAWGFSALMLAPTSAAVRQGADLAPDRYSYLAGLGYAMLVGGAALVGVRLVGSGRFSHATAGLVGVSALAGLVGLGAMSWSYAEVWRDSETLWRWAVEVDPECSVCHGKLGESALNGSAARVTEAEGAFRRAIALRPDLPDAYFNLGSALVIQGRYAEAEQPLRSYMERVPQAPAGPERLGLLYLLQHRYEASVPLLQTALSRRPDAPGLRGYLVEALQGRAGELRAQGRAPEADALAAEAVALSDGGGGNWPRR